MISRGLMRRLERLEARLDPNPKPCVHIEFYEMDQNGKLTRLINSAHLAETQGAVEARFRIRVVFVGRDKEEPIFQQTPNNAEAARGGSSKMQQKRNQ